MRNLYSVKSSARNPSKVLQFPTDKFKSTGLGNTVCKKSQKTNSDQESDIANEKQYNARKELDSVQELLLSRGLKHRITRKNKITGKDQLIETIPHVCFCSKTQFDCLAPTHLYSGGGISNMVRCKTPRCPSCAKKIYSEKHKELTKVLNWSVSEGLEVFMVTLTVSHGRGSRLEDNRKLLSKCKSKLFKHKVIQDHDPKWCHFTEENNESLRNGWHPHYHSLIAFDKGVVGKSEIESMKRQWIKMVKKQGGHASFERGLDIQKMNNVDSAAAYCAKDVETQAQEIKRMAYEVSSDHKLGSKQSLSIQKMIHVYAFGKWTEFGYTKTQIEDRIVEYYSINRMRTFQCCNNYRKILRKIKEKEADLTSEVSDTEKEEQRENEQVSRISLSPNAVSKLVKNNLWMKILVYHSKDKNLNNVYQFIIDKIHDKNEELVKEKGDEYKMDIDIDLEIGIEVFDSVKDIPKPILIFRTPGMLYRTDDHMMAA
jgi:hypothetical protein